MDNLHACHINYYRITTPQGFYAEHLTLLLVLKGQLIVEHDTHKQRLDTQQLYCLNGHQFAVFSANNEREAVVLCLEIDSLFFADQFPAFFNVHFQIPSEDATATANGELLQAITDLGLNEFNQRDEQKIYRMMKLESIIFLLTQRYQTDRHHPIQISGYRQLPDILQYVDAHIHEGIKVKDIAAHFYVSESALSKRFKKETGEQLSHYIKKIQIHKSLSSLQYSKKSIEQIALESGFASVKVYREQFKAFLKMTPTDYRQSQPPMAQQTTFAKSTVQSDLSDKEILHLLYQTVQQPARQPLLIDRRNRHLVIDEETKNGRFHVGETIIQLASLSDLTQVKVQHELTELIESGLIDCLYCQDLLNTSDISNTLANLLQLNSFPAFERLDTAFDFLVKHRLPLMIGFTLPTAATEYAADTSFSLIQKFLVHLKRKIDPSWVKHLRLSFQLPIDYSSAVQMYYLHLHDQIRHILPTVSIGIHLNLPDPLNVTTSEKQLRALHATIMDTADFINFDGDPNFVFHEDNRQKTAIESSHHYLREKIHWLKKVCHELAISKPLYLLNWNTLTGATVDYNGLFFRGAIILQELLGLSEQIQGYGFWLNNELHEQYTFDQPGLHAYSTGLDLYHFQSKKRPAFFCLSLIRRLQGQVIAQGEEYLMTKEGQNYQLLLWNTNFFDPHLSSEEAFLESQSLDISIDVQVLPAGRYQVKQLDFDRNHGAVFYVYAQFQSAAQLDRETEAYIDQKTMMKLHVFDRMITDRFRHFSTIDTNGVQLFTFTLI